MKNILFLISFLFLSNLAFTQAPTNGLVAYYPFNGDANDATGNGNHGIVNGATLTTDRFGQVSNAYNFISNTFIEIPNSSSLNLNYVTISAWINIRQFDSIYGNYIVSKGYEPENVDNYTLTANTNNGAGIGAKLSYGQTGIASPANSYMLNTWVHILGTYDGVKYKIFINGIKRAESNNTAGILLHNNKNIVLGKYSSINGVTGQPINSWLNGILDDIRIYNRALTDTEVQALYQAEAPPITIGTISPTSLCYGSTISVPFTSTLPSGTTYTVKLKKGTTTYQTATGTTSPISIQVPYNSSILYGTDYFIEVSSGTNFSSPSNALTIGAIYGANLYDAVGNNYYSSNICNGSTLTIYAKAFGYSGLANPDELAYKWYKNNVLLATETSSSLLVNSAGSYYAVVSQGSCSYSSNTASVSYSNTIYSYTNYNGEPVACAATSKRIESNYISNQVTYQWYKDNVLISGATNKVYNANSSGLYDVTITDGTCVASSSQTRFTFLGGIPASLYVSGNDTTICGSQSKYLQMNTYDSYATYQYQWQKNGIDISGATSPYYYANQAGKYRIKATQGSCTSYTKEKEIIVAITAQKPLLTAPYTKICGGSLDILSNMYGSLYRDDVKLNAFGYNFSNATSGVYKIVVSEGTSCQNESNQITLQFGQFDKPQIKYVGNTNICGSSDNVFLYADNLNMSGTINRQWKKDGVNISGEIYNRLDVYVQGTYTLVFSNGACTTESDPIVVTQTSPIMKIVNTDNTLFCSNRAVKLSVDGLGNNNTNFNNKIWYKDGVLIPNETSSDIYVTAAGIYTASINSNGCIGTTPEFEIKSGPPMGFISEPIGIINSGSTAQIHISNCVGEIKWYDAATGGSLVSSTNPFTTPTLTQNTNYWVTCSKEYCESARVQINVIVENPCPSEIIHNNTVTAEEYITSGNIQSTTNLPTGVKYNAKTHIELSPGFQVGSDEVFEAVIGGCESAENIPTDGLIAYYPFNSNANDGSGNSNNGTTQGNPNFILRGSQQALNFSPNSGQFVSVPNNSSFENLTSMTLSAWIKPSSFDLNCYTEREQLIGKGKDVSDNAFGLSIQRNTTPSSCGEASSFNSYKLNFELGSSTISSPIYSIDNIWKHVLCTYDGITQKIYVDGILMQQATVGAINTTNSIPLYFNYSTWDGGYSNTNGRYGGGLDDIRIYNRAMSDLEITTIYNLEK